MRRANLRDATVSLTAALVTAWSAPTRADERAAEAPEALAPSTTPAAPEEEDEDFPVDVVYSRRHISFGLGGGPVFFGSILDDGHYFGSIVGGLVNLGFGDHVDLRPAIYAYPAASSRGLFLPIQADATVRFGSTTYPVSGGFAFGIGYLFAPQAREGDWATVAGLHLRPQIVPLAIQLDRFELELFAALDVTQQRRGTRGRIAPAFVSGGIRFFFVGYDTQDVLLDRDADLGAR